MESKDELEELERLIGQLQGLHSEVSQLAKKSPNDGVNPFKLRLINKVILAGNQVLGDNYRPFTEFEKFDADDVPTNSDVTMIISQYMEQAERFRSDNVRYDSGTWKYLLGGKASNFSAGRPTKVGEKK
jgi:hypothetical protein